MISKQITRRRFMGVASSAAAGAWLGLTPRTFAASAPASPTPPLAVFSKIYQELNLNYEDSAAVTAEAGFDGIDCPARPGGQVLPERAAEDLPRYAETLAKHRLKILLLTSGITSVNTPHCETVLRAAAKLGVKQYRTGYWKYAKDRAPAQTLNEVKAQLKDLAALNKELGLCAMLQNHAGPDYVGAKVRDLMEVARDFDPAQIGIAFDLGHALNELNEDWRKAFVELRSHFAVVYVKDWKRDGGFAPFGQGDFAKTDFFTQLKGLNYRASLSVHNEYDWTGDAKQKTREQLTRALKSDAATVRRWWNG